MSLTTTIYIGTYLVCTQTLNPNAEETIPVCSKSRVHQLYTVGKFCQHCGAPVHMITQPAERYSSYEDWMDGSVVLSDEDEAFLAETGHDWIPNESLSWQYKGQEVIGFNMVIVNGYPEGVHEDPRLATAPKVPTKKQLNRLKKIFGYENIEVKYGVLVSMM